MKQEQKPSFWQREPAVNYYAGLCLAALVVALIVLVEKNYSTLRVMLVFLVGLIGLLTRWRWGPVLLLLVVGWCLLSERGPLLELLGVRRNEWFSDIFLGAAVVAFVASHYRLQALTGSIFPPDTRRRDETRAWRIGPLRLGRRGPPVNESRSPRQVDPWELGLLAVSLPLWPALAQVVLNATAAPKNNPGLAEPVWRAIVLAWAAGIVTAVLVGILGYWTRSTMTVEEATLFLQDILWHETRREQRRLNRWLAWARLRRERKKGDV